MSRTILPALKSSLSRLYRNHGNLAGGADGRCALTERRTVERRRHVSDFRHRDFRVRAATQAAGVGVYDLDWATGSYYCSPELKVIAGLADDSGEFSMDQLTQMLHPDDREWAVRKMEASLDPEGNGQFENEHRLVRPDGTIRWVKVRGQTFFADNARGRRILGASGIVIDITERREAEKALREQSEELRLALRVGNSGTFLWNAHSHEHRWCDEMLALYGLKREEFGGRDEDWLACLLPEDRESTWATVERSLETGEYATDFRIRRRNDGQVRWMNGRGQVYYDAEGAPALMIGINVDITEDRNTQEELRKFKVFSDNASDGHILLDYQGNIRYANRLICERLGYGEAEMLRLKLPDIDPAYAMERFHELFERSKGGRVEPFETVNRRKDGSTIPIEVSVTAVEFRGEWLMFAASRDITERKEAEAEAQRFNAELEQRVAERTAELQRANEALLQTNMELQHFAHAAAHDLQTPLRSIASFAQLLQEATRKWGDEQVQEWSSLVIDNTKRLQALILELLDYSRVDIQGLPFETVDLRELFDEVVASLEVLIRETGAEVSCGPLPALPADRTQLARVLQNLIENGIKYNQSRPPRLSVAAERQDGEWVLSVADNGVGIDPRHHKRIFEIFRRLHAYHRIPGTGIGLALCRRIVERHGGRMWVASEPGKGSIFFFSLPAPAGEAS
jgi:PAS domain S-box-containing protein